jgi:hypothetical protein
LKNGNTVKESRKRTGAYLAKIFRHTLTVRKNPEIDPPSGTISESEKEARRFRIPAG